MFHSQQQTSLISILSCEHGRLRREERDINKRDLQKALKHGTKRREFKLRWKVEYDGIIFIVDPSFSKEITAYPSPLALAPLDSTEKTNHAKAKIILSSKPELCKSHTVLVVDNSGSMRTHDIPLHRDRQVAAFLMLSLEIVAEQLFKNTANNSDVVSLIEFDQEAKVVFEREPMSWVLYNKLLSRRDAGGYIARETRKMCEYDHPDSNYLPALAAIDAILKQDCTMSVLWPSFFFPTANPVMHVQTV